MADFARRRGVSLQRSEFSALLYSGDERILRSGVSKESKESKKSRKLDCLQPEISKAREMELITVHCQTGPALGHAHLVARPATVVARLSLPHPLHEQQARVLAHRRLGDVVVAIVVHLPPPEPPLELDGRGPAAGNAGELHVVAHVANGSGQQERSEHGRFFFF